MTSKCPDYCYHDHIEQRVLSRRLSFARKPHICDTCGKEVRPGQCYARIFGLIEGEPVTQRYHAYDCLEYPDVDND